MKIPPPPPATIHCSQRSVPSQAYERMARGQPFPEHGLEADQAEKGNF